jgi:hypothetical protein
VLNEAEELNKRELDNGMLGVERKLFYRELISRFGHHLALQWNLCEEYNLRWKISPELAKEYAKYIQAVDLYDHPNGTGLISNYYIKAQFCVFQNNRLRWPKQITENY